MRRWLIRIGILLTACVTCGFAASLWAVRQTRHVPDFYARAARSEPSRTQAASRRLRDDFQRLKDDAAQPGAWCAAFSDNEINAWLVEELPRKLPQLLTSGGREPRIVIEDGKLLAAARFQNRHIDTVISCEVDVELTEKPNMLAVRVSNLKAGALPLPLSRFLRGISKELGKGGFDVRWDITDEGPVALLTIPSEDPRYARTPVVVESIEFGDGVLTLAGRTGQTARKEFAPRGPVHHFVSYQQGENRSRQTAQVVGSDDRSGRLR